MALTWQPAWPWFLAVGAVAAITAIVLLCLRGRGLAARRMARRAALALSLLAAALLALAAANPVLPPRKDEAGVHLAVVLDVSDSALRAPGGWPALREQVAGRLAELVARLDPARRDATTGSVVTFRGAAAAAVPPGPVTGLADAIRRLSPADFGGGEGTDISAGLDRAAALVIASGDRGGVLLVTDGNETAGDALAASRRLAALGIPIYVLALDAGSPMMGLVALDLPRQVNANAQTYLRGVLGNAGDAALDVTLDIRQNGGESVRGDALASSSTASFSLAPGSWARLRQPITFKGLGLQYVDIALEPAGQAVGMDEHRRRVYTHVTRPPRILAVGDDRWLSALPTGTAEVVEASPAEVDRMTDFLTFDAAVISSMPAGEFQQPTLQRLAQAVTDDGLGLLVANGSHQGAAADAATVLMTYDGTPIEPLLPLSSRPKKSEEPPSRRVIIVMDASGSMSGPKLEKSKEIARYIIENLLRPVDRLDLLVFTVDARQLVKDQAMDEAGKQRALKAIAPLYGSGGTDPRAALQLIAGRRLPNCGLIFISDGEFGRIGDRPDCRATVFAIDNPSVPADSPLRALADPFPVGPGFDPSQITIPYFQPEERKTFYEPGSFRPLAADPLLAGRRRLPVPDLPLPGNALTYLLEDADLVAVRPKTADPVLAYRTAGSGYVGAFASELPADWGASPDGQEAIAAWIRVLVSYPERNRYDFQLSDEGRSLALRVSLNAVGMVAPDVRGLVATLVVSGTASMPVPLRPDPALPGTFSGSIDARRGPMAQSAALFVSESGPDALPRSQRIPMLLPPEGDMEQAALVEAYTYGRNNALLAAVAAAGGGSLDPDQAGSLLAGRTAALPGRPLWPWLLVAAAFSYLLAIAIGRFNL